MNLAQRLRKESRNSILLTCNYPDLGVQLIGCFVQLIRIPTQVWKVTRRQHGISAVLPQKSFRGETVGRVVICWLFSRANMNLTSRQ